MVHVRLSCLMAGSCLFGSLGKWLVNRAESGRVHTTMQLALCDSIGGQHEKLSIASLEMS